MNTKILLRILVINAVFAMNLRSEVQIYQLSTPVSGYMTMSVQDLNGPSGSSGSFSLNFNSLSETIYLDTAAGTIRQVGAIAVTPSASNIVIIETQQIPAQFPNPPQNLPGTVTVDLGPNGGNVLSFDTGPRAATWSSTAGAYTIDGDIESMPMQGSYSLITGGQTFSGSFQYALQLSTDGGGDIFDVWTFQQISTAGYPNSISLTGFGSSGDYAGFVSYPNVVADVTAPNGFQMQLSPGAMPIWGGPGEFFSLQCNEPVTATNVASGGASITGQPQSVVVDAFNTATFTVTASGTVPLRYQWSFDGTNVAGATSSTLTIPNVVQTNLGTYAVVVTNEFGAATSSNATLSMYPFIATPFPGAITYWGKNASLSIQAWGTGPLDYQWFDNGASIPDATNSTLTLTAIQATNAGFYSVVVSSALGSATNLPAQVMVEPAGVSLGFSPTVTISGVVGYNYIVQASTNLAKTNGWATITNLTLTQPVQIWVDTNVNASSPFNSEHFYQVLPGQ